MGQESPGTPLLSVVIPTRNEADNVETLVARLSQVLAGVPVELVFIDDSSDATPGLLEKLSENRPEGVSVRAVHREPAEQTGLGSAAALGLKLAAGTVVAVMDGDLQHPPELLVEMVRELEDRDLDLVVASRYMAGGSARGLNGPARVLVSRGSKVVSQVLFREARKTSDPLSGYFLCRRAAIEGLEFRPIGFKILLEVLVCTAAARVGDVPLKFAERHAGRSNASMAQGVAFARHLWSLLVHVPGSARIWKYGTVGAAGLGIFLGLLAALSAVGTGPYLAWFVAFVVSLFLNWQLNRVVTFADVASPFTAGRGRPLYLPAALFGGLANLTIYVALIVLLGAVVPLAGLGGALTAMVVNYTVHRRLLRRPPRVRGAGADAHGLAARAEAHFSCQAHVLMAPLDARDLDDLGRNGGTTPHELLRAFRTGRPLLLAEAPSHKPQARANVGLEAWMAIPIVEGAEAVGLLVLQRSGSAFTADELASLLPALASRVAGGTAITPILAAGKAARR
ncbi:MAG: glycosyltransferase [Candidatus Dormibacteria bacterium]